MAQFSAWIHNVHSEQPMAKPQFQASYITNSMYSEPSKILSWNSEDDTDSDSEPSFCNDIFASRRKQLTNRTKHHKLQADSPSRAAPVAIPARTHDFGWCDRDDERLGDQTGCQCGNDCEDFFDGELDGSSSKCSRPEEDSDDFIFDMEM